MAQKITDSMSRVVQVLSRKMLTNVLIQRQTSTIGQFSIVQGLAPVNMIVSVDTYQIVLLLLIVVFRVVLLPRELFPQFLVVSM